jgi:uncharacterized membrane protein
MKIPEKTWHEEHSERRSKADRLADWVADKMGSWSFIIYQSIFFTAWIAINMIGYMYHWDPYPFILLNLFVGLQSSYAAPIIMMSQNRSAERDRVQARADYETNVRAKEEIEQLQNSLSRIENDKLDKILTLIQKEKENRN